MPSLFDLSGKVALITGSTRGIGLAIARRFAEHGAKVVISSRKGDACERVASEIDGEFGEGRPVAAAIPCNVNYKDQVENLIASSRKAFGQIDILVCNAAVNPYQGPAAGISEEAFDKTLTGNIKANHWLCYGVLPEMADRRDGSIIIISSYGGFRGQRELGTYALTKAADMQMARNIVVEYSRYNIRANCIAPALIKTDMARALWTNPEMLKRSTDMCPLGRIGEPDDIAGAAVYFASRASAFTNGQTIICDGGISA